MSSLRVLCLTLTLLLTAAPVLAEPSRDAAAIKADILRLARSFFGQGDHDFSRQRALNVLVDELLAVAPQPPVSQRLHLLQGAWKQVWGPYDYRDDKRGIDPRFTLDQMYQVVFPLGVYYNVSPFQGRHGEMVSLLRGEYSLVEGYPNMIAGELTDFWGNQGWPKDIPVWEFPAMAERETLPRRRVIVPSFIIWFFADTGYFREVYTDRELRITYGGDSLTERDDEYIYILVRP